MTDNSEFTEFPNPQNQNRQSRTSADYLTSAAEACAAGDMVLGMHLYLVAYEKALVDPNVPDSAALRSLREAWHLACDLKERSIAEYVFEKLEPYLSGDEVNECAAELQRLALDRLADFGFSPDDLEDVAEMISQDILDGDASVVKIEHIGTIPRPVSADEEAPASPSPLIDLAGFARMAAESVEAAQQALAQNAEAQPADGSQALDAAQKFDLRLPDMPPMAPPAGVSSNMGVRAADEPLSYRTLVGYDEAVSLMRDFGVGMQNDAAFLDFVGLLNHRHGLDRMPALDTILFRSQVREDAMRFVEATIGEIGLPALRMTMEENFQGMPVLCVMTQGDNHPRLNRAHNRFVGPGILVVEDLDLWQIPNPPENAEGWNGFMMANISRGVREAVEMVRAAVDDPNVYVLATSSLTGEVDPFFYDLLEPLSVIDIGFPNDRERSDIWNEIARDHPSMRTLNRVDLMRYSEGMARYDIYMAAREAVEEAYKAGLATRTYLPVSSQNIFEKLAAFQPLDSAAYQALEDKVVNDFQSDLDHLEDLIDGTWE